MIPSRVVYCGRESLYMKFLLFFVCILLAIFGLCEILHNFKLWLIFPKRDINSTLVVFLNEQTATEQMVFVGEQFLWLGQKFANRVIAVAENFSDQTLSDCHKLAVKYGIKLVVKGRV